MRCFIASCCICLVRWYSGAFHCIFPTGCYRYDIFGIEYNVVVVVSLAFGEEKNTHGTRFTFSHRYMNLLSFAYLHHHRSHSILLFICGICVYDFFFILFTYMCRNISSNSGKKNGEETFRHFYTVVCRCRHCFCSFLLILVHCCSTY